MKNQDPVPVLAAAVLPLPWDEEFVPAASEVALAIETRTGGRVRAVRDTVPVYLAPDASRAFLGAPCVCVPRWARIFWVFCEAQADGAALDPAWIVFAKNRDVRRAFLALQTFELGEAPFAARSTTRPASDDAVLRFVRRVAARGGGGASG